MRNTTNNAFCILPWVHVQVKQDANLYPCCRMSHNFSYGSIKDKNIDEVWNSDVIKKVRREMLAGKPQSFCSNCHKLESIGAESYRQFVNEGFKHEFSRIDQTDESGHLSNNTLPFLDLRFSNVCNFKCRICGSENSNLWVEDEKIMAGDLYITPASSHVVKLKKINPDIINQIYEKLPGVTNIYFAGGEPLLDENHYLLLEKLIELGRTDIIISYNTNLSVLNFGKWNALTLWKQFEHVQISASIDSIGPALELTRKGADWNETQKNLRLIKVFLPHVLLSIYPTISVLNCFNITELIEYFLTNNYILTPRHLSFGFVSEPKHLNVGVLNASELEKLELHYKEFLNRVQPKCPAEIYTHIKNELSSVINFSKAGNLQKFRGKLALETKMLDLIRNEKASAVLPELNSVLKGNSVSSALTQKLPFMFLNLFNTKYSVKFLRNLMFYKKKLKASTDEV